MQLQISIDKGKILKSVQFWVFRQTGIMWVMTSYGKRSYSRPPEPQLDVTIVYHWTHWQANYILIDGKAHKRATRSNPLDDTIV